MNILESLKVMWMEHRAATIVAGAAALIGGSIIGEKIQPIERISSGTKRLSAGFKETVQEGVAELKEELEDDQLITRSEARIIRIEIKNLDERLDKTNLSVDNLIELLSDPKIVPWVRERKANKNKESGTDEDK